MYNTQLQYSIDKYLTNTLDTLSVNALALISYILKILLSFSVNFQFVCSLSNYFKTLNNTKYMYNTQLQYSIDKYKFNTQH
jgi:hypothetical protein